MWPTTARSRWSRPFKAIDEPGVDVSGADYETLAERAAVVALNGIGPPVAPVVRP